jgi:hypothetical protein
MQIELIGKTEGVFKVRIDTEKRESFRLYSSDSCISANRYYIPEIIEMLQKASELLEGMQNKITQTPPDPKKSGRGCMFT